MFSKLHTYYIKNICEAGCDEAGRGPLAGPVFAAAVILDPKNKIKGLNDSKLLSENERNRLAKEIETKALAWSVASVDAKEIDTINILQSSLKAMYLCLGQLKLSPELVLVDGNMLIPYGKLNQVAIIKGDGKYQSIAAASILAKTYRDQFMELIHEEFPMYGWNKNKGYPTAFHRNALIHYGYTPYHRRSFKIKERSHELFSNA
jgi:ribonuclease HII